MHNAEIVILLAGLLVLAYVVYRMRKSHKPAAQIPVNPSPPEPGKVPPSGKAL